MSSRSDVTLVIGAAGFVGSAVARALDTGGWCARAFARKREGARDVTRISGPFEGDLRDAARVRQAMRGTGHVFPAGAIAWFREAGMVR